jgi:hypothetical protein
MASPSSSSLDRIPWPLRSIAAGTAGTAALTASYWIERRVRRSANGPLDYDDSTVPGQIVASILHLPHVSSPEETKLGLVLRWSYGSVFGLWHGILRRERFREPAASFVFGATLLTATLTLFPLLGRTPPPWRWSRAYLSTCVATHAAYVTAVGVVDDNLRDAS